MQIRPMVPEDHSAAAGLCTANGWDGVFEQFAFCLAHPASYPFVAEMEGELVATGVATCRGSVGWVGQITVDRRRRRSGIGTAMTRHVMDCLRDHGCRTLLLFATDDGRPVYERLGFKPDTEYVLMSGPALPRLPAAPGLRPAGRDDLDGIIALDRLASSEDRPAELAAYLQLGGWVTTGDAGRLTGFLLPTPWSTYAGVAISAEAGRLLLDVKRAVAGMDGRETASCALPAGNTGGLEHLRDEGFREVHRFPRMVWGEPLSWRPEMTWSRASGAMG